MVKKNSSKSRIVKMKISIERLENKVEKKIRIIELETKMMENRRKEIRIEDQSKWSNFQIIGVPER